MINPSLLFKLKDAYTQFSSNHPKFVNFFKKVIIKGELPEGTVIEMTVTKPGEEPISANMKVTASDVTIFNNLK